MPGLQYQTLISRAFMAPRGSDAGELLTHMEVLLDTRLVLKYR